jgi:PTH1 family peptidyl-tRNA hydrolase
LVVVGLGNPGVEYQFTPHNAGFLAIDRLAAQQGAALGNRRCRALTAATRIGGRAVVLAKPETFMNLSGESVRALVREFGADPGRDLIVIYDDLDLPLGAVRVRERGRPGSHNGARSITAALGSEEWMRVRVGVGPAAAEGHARRGGRDYLLTPLRREDLAALDEALEQAARAVRTVVEQGPLAAMNEFNRRERNGPAEQER